MWGNAPKVILALAKACSLNRVYLILITLVLLQAAQLSVRILRETSKKCLATGRNQTHDLSVKETCTLSL